MSDKRSSGFKDRRRGGRGGGGGSYRKNCIQLSYFSFLFIDNSSSTYHPYRPKGNYGDGSGRRFSNSSNSSTSSNRIFSINEAIKTDRILSIENFANVERIKDQDEVPFEYAKYVKRHQKAHLKNIFNLHKKEKW